MTAKPNTGNVANKTDDKTNFQFKKTNEGETSHSGRSVSTVTDGNCQQNGFKFKVGENTFAKIDQHSKEHIMISYCHKQKDLAHKLVPRLRKSGCKQIWIDSENMHKGKGILDEMADAVDNASVIVCLLSNDYYLSENCMSEIRYARIKKKTIIPVVAEDIFMPDKVLLLCIGDKYRFDLSTDARFALTYPLLEEKLRAEKLL